MKNKLKVISNPVCRVETLLIYSIEHRKYYFNGTTNMQIGDDIVIYGNYSTGIYQLPISNKIVDITSGYIEVDYFDAGYLMTGVENIVIVKEFKCELLSSLQDDYFIFKYNELSEAAIITDISNSYFTNINEIATLSGSLGNPTLKDFYKFKITKTNGTFVYITAKIELISSEVYQILNYDFDFTFFNAKIEGMLSYTRIGINVAETQADNNIAQFYYNPDRDLKFIINTKTILKGLFANNILNENDNIKTNNNTGLKSYTNKLVKKVFLNISSNSLNISTPFTFVFFGTPFASRTGRASLENYLPLEQTGTRESLNNFNPVLYKDYKTNNNQLVGFIGIFARDYLTSYINESIDDTNINISNDIELILYSKILTAATDLTDVTFQIEEDNGGFTTTAINTTIIKKEGIFQNELQIIWLGESGLMQYYFNCEYSEKINKENSYSVNNKYSQNNHSEKTREITANKYNISQNEMEAISTLLNCSQSFIYSETQKKLFNIKINTNSFMINEKDEVRYDINFTFELNPYAKL